MTFRSEILLRYAYARTSLLLSFTYMHALPAPRSTGSNYYTGLIETSKTHFYGRAAAELSFSEGVSRTFTRVREAVSF